MKRSGKGPRHIQTHNLCLWFNIACHWNMSKLHHPCSSLFFCLAWVLSSDHIWMNDKWYQHTKRRFLQKDLVTRQSWVCCDCVATQNNFCHWMPSVCRAIRRQLQWTGDLQQHLRHNYKAWLEIHGVKNFYSFKYWCQWDRYYECWNNSGCLAKQRYTLWW